MSDDDRLGGLFEPHELDGLRSIAFVVLDSLRWDSFQRAPTPVLDALAPLQEKRYAYASWTLPSHACLLSGLLPYRPRARPAADTYLSDQSLWAHALAGDAAARNRMLPDFSLAAFAQRCGWSTAGRVAMPVLNPSTGFSRGFDDYRLSPRGSRLADQVESLAELPEAHRRFVFVNCVDTHYPYDLPPDEMARVSGAHGALAGAVDPSGRPPPDPSDAEQMAELHDAQVRSLTAADAAFAKLADALPRPLLLVAVSDHGDLFGEDGRFGHGPFFHRALFEVPLAAGVVR